MRRKHILNSLSGVAQMMLSAVLVFITIPRFIGILGPEQYGIYSLSFLIGNIGNFTNLGLNSALIKFLGEQGVSVQSDIDISASYFFYLAVAIPFSLIMLIGTDFFLGSVFAIPQHFITEDVKLFYYLLVITNIFTIVGQTPSAILDISQQVYLNNLFMFMYNILYWGIIFTGLMFFKSLVVAGVASFTATIIWFIAINYSAIKSWDIKKRIFHFTVIRASIKKQIIYGSKLYSGSVLNMFFEPLSKILVSNFIGLKEVGFLDIAFRVKFYTWSVPSRLLYPVLPIIAQLKDEIKIRRLVYSLEQTVMLLIIPMAAVIIFSAGPFVEFWLKSPNTLIEHGIAIITGGYLLGSVLIPNYHYLLMKGHPEKTSIMQALNVLANTVVFFILLPVLGYYAILLGNFSALCASSLLGLYYQKKYLNTPLFTSFREIGKMMTYGLGIVVILLSIRLLPVSSAATLTVTALVIPLAAFLLIRLLSLISEESIELFFPGENSVGSLLRKVLL